jgi:hypothetical protein
MPDRYEALGQDLAPAAWTPQTLSTVYEEPVSLVNRKKYDVLDCGAALTLYLSHVVSTVQTAQFSSKDHGSFSKKHRRLLSIPAPNG